MAKGKQWRLLTTAPDQLTAELWKDILVQEGIPAMISPADTTSFMGVSLFPCRLLVARDYLEKAREVLADLEEEAGEAGESDG